MKILAIETATIVCGAALAVDGTIVCEEQIEQKNVHAENIMRLIDNVIHQSNIAPQQLDAIAVSIGPGSFTGLRIGLSVAKGLCFSLEKPLVAVSTLQALAQRAVNAGVVETPYIVPALDARRDEVYCQLFRVNGKSIEPVWDERDFTLSALIEEIGEREVTVTGDAVAKIKAHSNDNDASAMLFVREEYRGCSAAAVALIGEQMAMLNRFVDVTTVEPQYIKDFYIRVPNDK